MKIQVNPTQAGDHQSHPVVSHLRGRGVLPGRICNSKNALPRLINQEVKMVVVGIWVVELLSPWVPEMMAISALD